MKKIIFVLLFCVFTVNAQTVSLNTGIYNRQFSFVTKPYYSVIRSELYYSSMDVMTELLFEKKAKGMWFEFSYSLPLKSYAEKNSDRDYSYNHLYILSRYDSKISDSRTFEMNVGLLDGPFTYFLAYKHFTDAWVMTNGFSVVIRGWFGGLYKPMPFPDRLKSTYEIDTHSFGLGLKYERECFDFKVTAYRIVDGDIHGFWNLRDLHFKQKMLSVFNYNTVVSFKYTIGGFIPSIMLEANYISGKGRSYMYGSGFRVDYDGLSAGAYLSLKYAF